MTYLGILHSFLSLQVLPLLDVFFISLSRYVLDILNFFNMDDYKDYATPFQSGVKLTKYFE